MIKKTSYKKYLMAFPIHRNLILPCRVRLKYESMAYISFFYLMIIFRITVPQHHEIQSRFSHVVSQSFVLKRWTSSLNGLQHRYSMKSKARQGVSVFGLKSAKLTRFDQSWVPIILIQTKVLDLMLLFPNHDNFYKPLRAAKQS